MNSRYTEIYTLSLHDALPIYSATSGKPRSAFLCALVTRPGMRLGRMSERAAGVGLRSEEQTDELQVHRDLHSFPTRRSSDLQRHVGKAAVRVPLRAGDETRNEARTHVGEVGGDRIGERELGLSAAEQYRLLFADERPRHGFDHRAACERPLGAAIAQLQRREDRLARVLAPLERRQRHLVDADDAHHLLDDVGL